MKRGMKSDAAAGQPAAALMDRLARPPQTIYSLIKTSPNKKARKGVRKEVRKGKLV
jgi:hypothetical protein